MKKVLFIAVLALGLFTSCSKDDDGIDCAAAVNDILEEYQPLLEVHLPEDPTVFDPLFDWQPFYDVLAERDAAIEAIGCN